MSCFISRLVLYITHAYNLAIERYVNRISWYLYRRGRCKMGRETRCGYLQLSITVLHFCLSIGNALKSIGQKSTILNLQMKERKM